MNAVFAAASLVVLPFWVLAIAAPGWSWTERILRSPWIAAPPAALYAALILPRLREVFGLLLAPGGPQLADVAAGFATPEGAALVWLHLVAFDLLAGRWVYLDARERGVPWWISSPVLALVFLVGPLGWLLHLALRPWAGRAPR